MGYRGEDLDLRTPQTWSGTPPDLANASELPGTPNGQRGGFRTGPIWVDDTVLACSNHAYDIALAHRAGEVRLEHLLHALTRIDAAAEALEARGVRVAALRRETATIIASEIPVGLPIGKGMPHRSEEFAEVLRLSAVNASRRNSPAGIEDLLFVLLDQRTEFTGLGLLARHTARPMGRDTVEPLPPLTRYSSEPRYAPVNADRYGRMPAPEIPRYAPDSSRIYRSEFAGTPTDSIQNTRIEALEQIVRALSNDLASERQVVSGVLKDLSRDNQVHRDDQGRLQPGLHDRMQTLEQAVTQTRSIGTPDTLVEKLETIETSLELRLQEMSQSWALLSTRLQDLEMAVRQTVSDKATSSQLVDRIRQAIDFTPLTNRLDIIEEALLSGEPRSESDVADRLKTLEGAIARALAANTASTSRMEALITGFERNKGDGSGPVLERVTALTSSYQAQQAATNELGVQLVERMTAVEQALAADIETAAAKHQAYAQGLGEVHDAIMKLNKNQHTLAGSIDQWRSEAAGDIAAISNHLTNLDRDNERPIETLTALTGHMDTMNRLMIERYHRRNRFWYWLFGTDDWIGASWPSQAAAMEAERQKLKVAPTA